MERPFRRRSLRLRCYDYTSPGAYFITICTQDRAAVLGRVVNDRVRLTEAGRMVQATWKTLPLLCPGTDIDAFVVMPDHIHGIILMSRSGVTTSDVAGSTTVSDCVRVFKSLTTKHYVEGVRAIGWPAVRRRLWQRNFYERIIRDDVAMNAVRAYIDGNPARWRWTTGTR